MKAVTAVKKANKTATVCSGDGDLSRTLVDSKIGLRPRSINDVVIEGA